MIVEKGLNIAGIRMMLSAMPCWELKPCSVEDRKSCDAYINSEVPCWGIENKGEKCKTEDCRECSVYLKSAQCSSIKHILKRFWRSKADGKTV
jgi:MerR family transcriptional regulator/heat shock protein HspR